MLACGRWNEWEQRRHSGGGAMPGTTTGAGVPRQEGRASAGYSLITNKIPQKTRRVGQWMRPPRRGTDTLDTYPLDMAGF